AGALVEIDRERVHRFERTAEALAALARAACERAHLAELLGQQREHQVGLAVLDATQQQRFGDDARGGFARAHVSRGARRWRRWTTACVIALAACRRRAA